MSETPRTGDRDPIKWVNTAQRVEAHYAIGDDVAAVGKVVSYCEAPTVTIETDDGRRVSWRVDLTDAVEKTAETGAEYVFRSNLRGDGAAFLSLHRLGADVHLRLRHVTSEPLAFEVAVLSPSERRALITALTEIDAEAPVRMSVRVPNEPHGLPNEIRQRAANKLAAGDKAAAVRELKHAGVFDPVAYVEDMEEYQTYLSKHGEKRRFRYFTRTNYYLHRITPSGDVQYRNPIGDWVTVSPGNAVTVAVLESQWDETDVEPIGGVS